MTLLRNGSASVDDLAGPLGLTPNGVRIHLAALERDGWVVRAGVRKGDGAGKPAVLYALAEGAGALLSAAYRPLLRAMLATMHESETDDRMKRLLRETGRRLAADVVGSGGVGPGSLRARVGRLLESLGAAVTVQETGPGTVAVQGAGCPVGEAVTVEPRVCLAMTALLEGALDAEVRETCDRQGGAPRCRFEITA